MRLETQVLIKRFLRRHQLGIYNIMMLCYVTRTGNDDRNFISITYKNTLTQTKIYYIYVLEHLD